MLPETSEASSEAGNVENTQEMLKRLKKTHRRDLQQLARKQKVLKRFMRHTGGIFKSYSPEAECVEKIQETHRRNVQKLAQKQKILKRLKKTHWRNLHKLARKQEMLKDSRRHNSEDMMTSYVKLGTELCSKLAEIRDLKFEYLHTE